MTQSANQKSAGAKILESLSDFAEALENEGGDAMKTTLATSESVAELLKLNVRTFLNVRKLYDTCLGVTRAEYDAIMRCEAVVVREYESPDGSRLAKVVAWGDASEMQDQADTPGMFVVPVGYSIVCQNMVLVSDLLKN